MLSYLQITENDKLEKITEDTAMTHIMKRVNARGIIEKLYEIKLNIVIYVPLLLKVFSSYVDSFDV